MWHQTAIRLRSRYSKVSVGRLCNLFGKTRHAFYDNLWHHQIRVDQEQIVLELLLELRRDMSGAGIPTIYDMLRQPLLSHGIKMGRDALQELRRKHGLIEKPRKKYISTTDSYHNHHKYPNIIKGLKATRAEQLWVSDITYLKVGTDFNFLCLIMDTYSRKIVGYCLHSTLSRQGPLVALQMAISGLSGRPRDLIHHSDRGIQYCCEDYIAALKGNNIRISMTEKGDPYENALAERLNGILKKIFGLDQVFKDRMSALKATDKAVRLYNEVRPHTSIAKLTPAQAHSMSGELKPTWKKKPYRKKTKSE